FLLAHLRESRVEVLARPTGRTSTALARLAADGSADYDFRLRWAPDESLVEDGPRSILHFGSIAAFLQPGATVVDRLIDRIASPTLAWPEAPLLTFDPNIRPSIIGSHDAACLGSNSSPVASISSSSATPMPIGSTPHSMRMPRSIASSASARIWW